MGTWGMKLYEDDIAKEVRENYNEKIKIGKTNQQALAEILENYADEIEDYNDGPIFWFALADTMWDLGVLVKEVKDRAILEIEKGENLKIWKREGTNKQYEIRKKILEELKVKLNSKMPKSKKVSKEKIYKCEWKIGDIFAYKIKNEYMEGEGVPEKYLVIIKVAQDIYYPSNLCPIVYVYNKIFDKIPTIEELDNIKYLPQFFSPKAYKEKYKDILYKCFIGIENETKIYIEDYIYIGNNKNYKTPVNEINSIYELNNIKLCLINNFEKEQKNNYELWKNIKY